MPFARLSNRLEQNAQIVSPAFPVGAAVSAAEQMGMQAARLPLQKTKAPCQNFQQGALN
jgi:hypothetical protein